MYIKKPNNNNPYKVRDWLIYRIEQLRISCGNDHKRFSRLSKRHQKQLEMIVTIIRKVKIEKLLGD